MSLKRIEYRKGMSDLRGPQYRRKAVARGIERGHWINVPVIVDAVNERNLIGRFLPADSPFGVMETLNGSIYARGNPGEVTLTANAPLTIEALAKRFAAVNLSREEQLFVYMLGYGGRFGAAGKLLSVMQGSDKGVASDPFLVLADYASFPSEIDQKRFPTLGTLRDAGQLVMAETDVRYSPAGFFRGPALVTAIYLMDSLPSKMISKSGGKFYEHDYCLGFPHNRNVEASNRLWGAEEIDQTGQIKTMVETMREQGVPPQMVLGTHFVSEKRELRDIREIPFGGEIANVTEGMDGISFPINNQALDSVLAMAKMMGDSPWVLQILDMAIPSLEGLSRSGALLDANEHLLCWLALNTPLWKEVLARRGLSMTISPYKNFMETTLGYKLALITDLYDVCKSRDRDRLLSTWHDWGSFDFLLNAIADAYQAGALFLLPGANPQLREAFSDYHIKPEITDHLYANADKIWKLAEEAGCSSNLYYIEISNQ